MINRQNFKIIMSKFQNRGEIFLKSKIQDKKRSIQIKTKNLIKIKAKL